MTRDDASPTPRTANGLAVVGSVILILAAWFVLQVWGLGAAAFHTKGEPREALVVLEIAQRGDWLLPRRNGIELPAKPPLFHWLGAVVSLLQGKVDEWSVRLPSALLSGVATLIVFATGVCVWSVGTGLFAALSLLTSFEWLRAATSARVDMTLSFGLTLSFCGLLMVRENRRGWLPLVYLGMAWAVLAKGPVGIALPLLQVAVITIIDRRLDFVRSLRLGRGLIIVVLVGAAWYLAASIEGGNEFFEKQILKENVYRFIGTQQFSGGHRHSVGYLAAALLAGLLPWTVFFPSSLARLTRRTDGRDRPGPHVFAAVWVVVVFAFYAIATSKRGVYLLALYPAAMLLLGSWWSAATRGDGTPTFLRPPLIVVASLLAIILALTGIAAFLEVMGVPVFSAVATAANVAPADRQLLVDLTAHALPLAALLFIATLAALSTAVGAYAGRWGIVYGGCFMVICATTVVARQIVMPAIGREASRERFMNAVLRVVPDRSEVGSYRDFDYGLAFYWGGNLPVVAAPLSADGPRFLVMPERQWVRLGATERRLYDRVPGLRSGRAGNFGEMVLLRRVVEGDHDEPIELETPPAPSEP